MKKQTTFRTPAAPTTIDERSLGAITGGSVEDGDWCGTRVPGRFPPRPVLDVIIVAPVLR